MNVPPARDGFVDPSRPAPPEAPPIRQGDGNGLGASQPVIDQPPIESRPPPAAVEPAWPIRVKLLHKPIRNERNELVHELAFREPTGGDINRYGNPTRITLDGEVVIDEQKMMRVMAALSGLLPPLLEPMDPRDWNSCAYRLRNFFLPDLGAW
jgi:hypothetical protein